ncbi:MAG: hypothetical protein LBD59_02325 [Prevotellaceae bacterium]|jgi:hypothetical protein|nr:hypothetical protein [Prevotellaceae bacterium]
MKHLDKNKYCNTKLGHGQFVLKHTFDKDYKLPQGKTDNLMDYTRGARHIAKWQWDLIHDPGVVMRVFERDKDAASRLIIIDKKHTALFNHVWDGLTFNWLTKSALSTADENVSFIGFTGTNIYGLAGLDVPVFQRINLLLYGLFGAQQYKISDSGFSSGDYTVNSLVSEEHIRSKD